MKAPFSRPRRFAVAIASLMLAGLIFRSQIAQALVIRGDDYVFRGDRFQALERYRRAMAIAPFSETAVDRYVFISMQLQTPQSIAAALQVANRYLEKHPNDTVVLADRALCYLHLRRYALASTDFQQAAAASHSARYALFARLARRAEHRR
jgi:tetratricopeptide (TPR) repeat protein